MPIVSALLGATAAKACAAKSAAAPAAHGASQPTSLLTWWSQWASGPGAVTPAAAHAPTAAAHPTGMLSWWSQWAAGPGPTSVAAPAASHGNSALYCGNRFPCGNVFPWGPAAVCAGVHHPTGLLSWWSQWAAGPGPCATAPAVSHGAVQAGVHPTGMLTWWSQWAAGPGPTP